MEVSFAFSFSLLICFLFYIADSAGRNQMYCNIHCKSFPLLVAADTKYFTVYGKKKYCSHVTVLLILLGDKRRGKTSTRTNNRHFVSKTPIDLSPQSNYVNFIWRKFCSSFVTECGIIAATLT